MPQKIKASAEDELKGNITQEHEVKRLNWFPCQDFSEVQSAVCDHDVYNYRAGGKSNLLVQVYGGFNYA